ncbi:MAG: hypothetical protein ACLFP6_02440 [Spirochaetaceae bacterium]
MMRSARFRALLLILALLPILPLHSQERGEPAWESSIDWGEGALELRARMPIDRSGPNAPAAQHRAEQRIATELPGEIVRALLPMQVDSRTTLGDVVERDPSLYQQLAALSSRAERVATRPDRSLSSVEVHYRVEFYPRVTEILTIDETPTPFRRVLDWVPSTDYTGLVIYAAEALPVHGTNRTTRVEPALFPEIIDSEMQEVLSREQLSPEWLGRWGSAAYSDSLDLSSFRERIGENPKRVVAHRLFGIVATDVVIGREDALELLSRPANRRLLREGRIVIVTAPPTD